MYRLKKRLKIAQLTPYYHPSIGGVEAVAKYVSEELALRGHKVHIFTTNRCHGETHSGWPHHEDINGVSIHRYHSIFNIGHMSICPQLLAGLSQENFDLIHIHGYRHPHGEIARWVGSRQKAPTVLQGHGPFFHRKHSSPIQRLLYALYDWQAKFQILKKIDCIFALTPFEKQQFVRLGADPGRILIVPNAADEMSFQRLDARPLIAKYRLNRRKILLYVGNLNNVKRLDLLLRALSQLVSSDPRYFLLIIGPDEGIYSQLRQLGNQLNISNHFRWLGPLYGEEKHRAFEAAEIFMLASDVESFSVVLLEAMAHGKPIVASNAVGPSVIVRDGYTGILFPKGDVSGIVKAVQKICADEVLAHKMGERARQIAQNRYSVPSVVNVMENAYYRFQKLRRLNI